MDFDRIVLALHSMPTGKCLVLGQRERADVRFNTVLYDDLIHALRGNLVGSGWGVYDFVERPHDGSLLISKLPAQERMILDRDGHPIT